MGRILRGLVMGEMLDWKGELRDGLKETDRRGSPMVAAALDSFAARRSSASADSAENGKDGVAGCENAQESDGELRAVGGGKEDRQRTGGSWSCNFAASARRAVGERMVGQRRVREIVVSVRVGPFLRVAENSL